MGVFLQRRGDGWDKRWKGRWTENGRTYHVSLNCWQGTPPARGEKKGDELFEKSRVKALERLEAEKAKANGSATAKRLELIAQERRFREARSQKPRKLLLSGLAEAWDNAPHRKAEISQGRRDRIHSVLNRFVKFMSKKFPKVEEAGDVAEEHFAAFLASVEKSGVTGRTYNDVLDILREVWKQTRAEGPGYLDYLALLPHKDQTPVSRAPLTDEELNALFAAARETDPELYPVLLAGVATGMRRGDLCLLKWDDVDTEEGFITCLTHKTRKEVEIPIDDPLLAMLEEAEKARNGESVFVWPGVALAYRESPRSLNRRLNKILAAAGFAVPVYDSRNRHGKRGRATPAPRLKGGEGRCTVADAEEGERRRYRASKIGWHSLRTSFVTAALSRGVDPETVMAMTGHTSLKTLFRHYDQRTMKVRRQQMRRAYTGMEAPARRRALPGGEAAALPPAGEAEVVVAKPLPNGLAGLLESASPEQLAAVAALLGAVKK